MATSTTTVASLSPAGAAYLRRDILERPVVWVHAQNHGDEVPPNALGWPVDGAIDASLDALGLTPCVFLPSAASQVPAPAHALELSRLPSKDDVAPLEARARERLIEAILDRPATLGATRMPAIRFSVIIPTYQRVPQAVEAVRACRGLDYASVAYEVVVADNGPCPEPLQEALATLRAELPSRGAAVRLVHMPVTGVSMARNAAIAAARGGIICSLDDDCRPRADWLRALDEAWRAWPHAGVIGGQMLLQLPDPVPEAFQPGWEALWSHLPLEGDPLIRCEDWRSYPWGGNWSARRETLLRVGGFPVRYGARGKQCASGEEIAVAAAIALEGLAVALCPAAIVEHRPERARYTLDHVRRTLANSALLEHHLHRDGLISSATSPWGTLGQMLRAASTMVAAGATGRRALARDRRLRLEALAIKLRAQVGGAAYRR